LLDGAIGNHRYSRELTLQVMLSGAVLTIEGPAARERTLACIRQASKGPCARTECL
jgi:hypothetical protein